ncbi:MAG: hypothetical protein KC501_39985 [Myxococcales bacterium]|nr:hypothetical protein [Myxococcales bacterium]
MFDVVFVTCLRDHRSFRLGQRTVAEGLRGIGSVLAVVPDDERAAFERLAPRARVIPESSVDPRLAAIERSWFKQQLIKLCLHRVIDRPAALVLDSDTLLCRPVDVTWFAPDGRVPFYVEDRRGRVHPQWHQAAGELLEHEPSKRWSYFPTPNFVHREALTLLHDYLGELWGGDPFDGLAARLGRYTEWSTYGLFVDELLAEDSPHRLCDADHVTGIWDRDQLDAWEPSASEDTPPLAVVQSAIGASWAETTAKLRRLPLVAACLEPQEQPAHA